jgi:hypothetical protein
MEMGNLSSREIEPDRAVAELFSHYGGGQQSRESGAEAVVEQSQHLAIALRRIRFDPLDLPMLFLSFHTRRGCAFHKDYRISRAAPNWFMSKHPSLANDD